MMLPPDAGRKQVGTPGHQGRKPEILSLKGVASFRRARNLAGSGSEIVAPPEGHTPTRTPCPKSGHRAAATWTWADEFRAQLRESGAGDFLGGFDD